MKVIAPPNLANYPIFMLLTANTFVQRRCNILVQLVPTTRFSSGKFLLHKPKRFLALQLVNFPLNLNKAYFLNFCDQYFIAFLVFVDLHSFFIRLRFDIDPSDVLWQKYNVIHIFSYYYLLFNLIRQRCYFCYNWSAEWHDFCWNYIFCG